MPTTRLARAGDGTVCYLQAAYDRDIGTRARPGNAVVVGLQDGDAGNLADACAVFADFDLILEWRGKRVTLHAMGSEGVREIRAALGGDA